MTSKFSKDSAAFALVLQEFGDNLNRYAGVSKAQIYDACIKKRLDDTLRFYNQDLQNAANKLARQPARDVFKEVAFQQKRAYQNRKLLFDTQEHKKKFQKECSDALAGGMYRD